MHGRQRDAGSVGQRPPVDAGGHRRKRDGLGAEFISHPQRLPIAGREQLGAVLGTAVHRTDGVDHPAGRQLSGGSGDRLAGRQTLRIPAGPQFPALRQNRRAAAAVNRAIDPTPAEQCAVGGIHHCVDVLFGDIALHQGDLRSHYFKVATGCYGRLLAPWCTPTAPPVIGSDY